LNQYEQKNQAEMLDVDRFRRSLKAGPLSTAYAAMRTLKRRLKGEPLVGTVRVVETVLDLEALLSIADVMADHSRFHFSLALAHLDSRTDTGVRRARACLRAAELLDFESNERLILYNAIAAMRLGRHQEAARFASSINSYDLTAEENALLQQALSSNEPAFSNQNEAEDNSLSEIRTVLEQLAGVNSLLVCRDETAVTCDWIPNAKYLLVSEQINGLMPGGLGAFAAGAGMQFDVGVGLDTDRVACFSSGVTCGTWITIES